MLFYFKYPFDFCVEKRFACTKMKMKIVGGTRALSSCNSHGPSLCRCLAITPNLVVSSGPGLKRLVIHRKAPPRSIHRTASFPMYTNFRCSFGCITHIFYGCRERRFATRYFPMFPVVPGPGRRMNAFAICICRTLTQTQVYLLTVSDGHASTPSLFPKCLNLQDCHE